MLVLVNKSLVTVVQIAGKADTRQKGLTSPSTISASASEQNQPARLKVYPQSSDAAPPQFSCASLQQLRIRPTNLKN